jgi:hypothetical protein
MCLLICNKRLVPVQYSVQNESYEPV